MEVAWMYLDRFFFAYISAARKDKEDGDRSANEGLRIPNLA
jgi:hypothetical protein